MIIYSKRFDTVVTAKDFRDVDVSDAELLCTRYVQCHFLRVNFGETATRENFKDCYFENCKGYKEPQIGSYYVPSRPMTVAEAAKVLLTPDEKGNRTTVYDACEKRVKVYKFDAVLRALSQGAAAHANVTPPLHNAA